MKKQIYKTKNKKTIAFKRRKQNDIIASLMSEMRIQMSM